MKYLLDTNICIYWFKGLMGINKRISVIDIEDILVSAITIIVNDCVLVTNNIKHFERIDGLTIENWISQ